MKSDLYVYLSELKSHRNEKNIDLNQFVCHSEYFTASAGNFLFQGNLGRSSGRRPCWRGRLKRSTRSTALRRVLRPRMASLSTSRFYRSTVTRFPLRMSESLDRLPPARWLLPPTILTETNSGSRSLASSSVLTDSAVVRSFSKTCSS